MPLIMDLPNEILIIIFDFSVNEKRTLRLVCHRWNNLILGQFRRFIGRITLDTEEHFINFLEKSRIARINSLVVRMQSDSIPSSEIIDIRLLSNLKELELVDCEYHRSGPLERVLKKSPNLSKLTLQSWAGVEFVPSAKFEFLTDLTVQYTWISFNIFRKLPRLEIIKLHSVNGILDDFDGGMLDNLKVLRLTDVDSRLCQMMLRVIPKTLERLDYIMGIDRAMEESSDYEYGYGCGGYEDDYEDEDEDCYNPLETLVKREIKLKSLDLGGRGLRIISDDLESLLCRIKSLEYLSLGSDLWISIGSDSQKRICRSTNLKKIHELDMSLITTF